MPLAFSAALTWAADATMDEIVAGLETFTMVSGRMEIIPLRNGAFVINDTYNANPASMSAATLVMTFLKYLLRDCSARMFRLWISGSSASMSTANWRL